MQWFRSRRKVRKRHAQVPIHRLNSAAEIVIQSTYRCHLVKLEARITQRPLQGMRREKCMLRNPMNHRYQTRHHSLLISSWLGVTHGRTVKIDQAVAWRTWIGGDCVTLHGDRNVTNSLKGVPPYFVGDCKQKVTRPAGTPSRVTVKEMIDSWTVSYHEARTNSCCHFKTFQWIIASDALSLPPTENHGIEVKLFAKWAD